MLILLGTKAVSILAVVGTFVVSAFAGVTVSSPSTTTVSSPTHFVASASSDDPISTLAIYVDGVRKYSISSYKLDTSVSMTTGSHFVEVKAWDSSGTLLKKTMTLNVGQSSTGSPGVGEAKTYYDIEAMSGWQSCSDCAANPSNPDPPLATYYLKQHVASPSQDADSTEFHIGGAVPYANVLFSKRLEGDATVIAKAHHFIYEMNFYYTNAPAVQALEFDINQMIDGKRFIWGTQCNVRAGAVWDIWDNLNHRWVHTGAPCTAPPTYTWNKVVLEMERTSDNKLRYISITLNGTKHYLNQYYSPTSTSWTGLTLNFQLDGNVRMEDYSIWVDNFSFKWW